MKKIYLYFAVGVSLLVLLGFALVSPLRGDRQSKAEAVSILTSGEWHFEGPHFSDTRVFDPKGTMTRHGNGPRETKAIWKANYKEIVISFSYYQDVLLLPIDPKGTKGIDAWGDEFTATMPNGGGEVPTPAPTGIDALAPMATPTPAAAAEAQSDKTVAQLTAKKWLFTGSGWSEKRTFKPDGTIIVDGGKSGADNHWQIVNGLLVMTLADRKEVLYLPLDPAGTTGKDGFGFDITAVQVSDTAGSSSASTSHSVFGTSAEPPVPAATATP